MNQNPLIRTAVQHIHEVWNALSENRSPIDFTLTYDTGVMSTSGKVGHLKGHGKNFLLYLYVQTNGVHLLKLQEVSGEACEMEATKDELGRTLILAQQSGTSPSIIIELPAVRQIRLWGVEREPVYKTGIVDRPRFSETESEELNFLPALRAVLKVTKALDRHRKSDPSLFTPVKIK